VAKSSQGSTTGQVARFGMVGIMNTVIDYVIYISLTKIFSIPLDQVWTAKFVSGTVAMINSFYFNRTWVFKRSKSKNTGQEAIRFLIATFVAVYIIQLGLVQFFSSEFQLFGVLTYDALSAVGVVTLAPGLFTEAFVIKTVAFGLATLGSMAWNFVLYKTWAFKE